MAGNADLQRKLNQGVEAAKDGNRSVARRLLEEVVEQDERNEVAWIWLATLATGAAEKREHLKRVLAINPQNNLAREALSRLGDEPAPPSRFGGAPTLQETARRTDALAQQPSRGNSGLIFVFAAIALLLAGVGVILFGSGVLSPAEPTATPTLFVAVEVTDENFTPAPSDTPVPQPSTTPVPIDQITRSAPTLPPTPTATLTPSLTPSPQVTLALELGTFEVFFVSQDPSLAEPSMFSVMADGRSGGLVEDQVRDLAFAADGTTFAFVRDVPGAGGTAAEIFVSTIDDPGDFTQVTSLGSADTSSPSFSPDGTRIVFSSSNTRPSPDLWVIGVDGNDLVQLTDTASAEREPTWSPAGGQIAFTSDQGSVGSTEIFLITVTETGEALGAAVQATNADRSSYSPSWSANGRMIVFASDRTGDGDLFTMDSAGNNEQLLTIDDNDAEDRRPSFSPDGLWVIFASNREDGNFQTYVMRTNGTDVRRVTVNPRIDISARFRPRSLEE